MRHSVIVVLGFLAAAGPVEARPSAAGAKAFLTALYVPYRSSSMNESAPLEKPSNYFEATLAKAIIADARDAEKHGDAPNLDGDPICDCQDYEPFKATIGPIRLNGDRAEADVMFTNFEKKRLHYSLVSTKAGWRIYDIVSDGHSLRGMFDH
jgi:hypothetical protein